MSKIYLKQLVYAAFCCIINCLIQASRKTFWPLGCLKSERLVWFKRMKYLISDGMNENKTCNCNDYVVDIDKSCNKRSKHFPVSSIVFSTIGKNNISTTINCSTVICVDLTCSLWSWEFRLLGDWLTMLSPTKHRDMILFLLGLLKLHPIP